jgi:putative ABC transport system permease protein
VVGSGSSAGNVYMNFALATLWHERQRYLPGILAVAFSAVLIALTCGLLLGLLSVTSIPITRTRADVWVGSAGVLSVDIAGVVPTGWYSRVMESPEVTACEEYCEGFSKWKKPNGADELIIIVGCRLEDGSLGAVNALTPELREKLTEPNSVVIDESELPRLGLTTGVGETGEILGRKVRVVGLIKGYSSLAGPYVFCSLGTARPLLRLKPDQASYLLAKTRVPAEAPVVADRLRERYGDELSAFTSAEFTWRSEWHWLTKTKAGIAMAVLSLLGLLVGAVVTGFTLYAATAASIREYAVLRALGIPRWRMGMAVMNQSFWVGVMGVAVGLPTMYGLARAAEAAGNLRVSLAPWLLGSVAVVTLAMALVSGLAALRILRQVEPANLLR